MFIYGKLSAKAISVMSYLAERPERRAGSQEISKARRLAPAITAKLLTQLASAGLLSGQPGPGGGYSLARPARNIRLFDIVRLFENTDTPQLCPFGPDWCGRGARCPLHDSIADALAFNNNFLMKTRLDVFIGKPPMEKRRAARSKASPGKKDK